MDETKNNTQNTDTEQAFSQLEGELKTRFELLPTELQQVITSSDYQNKLFEIAKKYKITYEKLGQIELETTMVLLGITPPDEFKLGLHEQLKVDDTTLNNIVRDLNEQIFVPIRQQLMGIYSQEEVEIGEKFANDVTMTESTTLSPATPSPYREAITIKETLPEATQTAVPTGEKVVEAPAPAKIIDPYRELPETPTTGKGVASTVEIKKDTPKGSIDDSFLKNITPLTAQQNKEIEKAQETLLNKTKDLGGLTTMPMSSSKTKESGTSTNQEATLKKIQNLKDALLPTSEPIVQKEMISGQPPTDTLLPSNPFFENGQTSASIPKPENKVSALGGEIKMAENPLSYREPVETTPKEATIQKIDSLINMKKLEFFTDDKKGGQSVGTPPINIFTSPAQEKNSIYDGEIGSLQNEVKKTGFFAKMKNFFGTKKDVVSSNPVVENKNIPTPQVPTQNIPPQEEIVAKGPVDDTLLDDVKIFDETPIQK